MKIFITGSESKQITEAIGMVNVLVFVNSSFSGAPRVNGSCTATIKYLHGGPLYNLYKG